MKSDLQILLVEDNPGDVDLIEELLEQSPANRHQITKQATLGDALGRLRTDAFDLVLLDLGLPDSQGLETLRSLITAAPLLPVVVLTGFDDEATGIATVHEGAQDYLIKGRFDGAVLWRVIRYAIERQQSIRKIQRLNNILSAIRQINQLIVREKDRQRLIEKGVRPMVDFGAWDSAWIILFDNSGLPEAWAEAGIGENFSLLIDEFKQGRLPGCARELFAEESEGIFITHDRHKKCRGCPLEYQSKGGSCMSFRLQNNGQEFGMITVALKTQAAYENELELVQEAADDIGLGLHSIRMEEQKNAAEEQFQRMFYESTFPVMLHAENGEVLAINKAWRDLAGYRHDEIPTIADWTEKAYGERKNEIKAHIEKLYEANRRTDEGEFGIHTKNGEIRTWRFHATPLGRLPDGRRIVMSQAEDITNKKQAEVYREHYIQELQLVSDTIIQASRITDIDALCQLLGDTIHSVNPQPYVLVSLFDRIEKAIKLKSIHGFGDLRKSVKASLGKDLLDISFRPEDMGDDAELYTTGLLEQIPGGLYQLLAGKIPKEKCREIEAVLEVGSVYTTGFALEDRPYGGVSLLLKIGQGIGFRYAIETLVSHFSVIIQRQQSEEDRKQLVSELRQAQKLEAIGTLAGGIAHDFNNILSSIIGYSELLLEDVEKDTLFEQNLKQIYAAGARAKDLVKQILTFSRQSEQELIPLNVKLLVKESVKLLRASLPKSIDIRQKLETDTLVKGDPAQIHQIIMNLCTNAAQAMEHTGVITICLENTDLGAEFTALHPGMKPGKHVALRVSDTGPGIDPSITGKIFDPFFTTKSEDKGTGLGLSVVHGIVEGHHGMIQVKSRLGEGSEFIVYLPAAEFAPTQPKPVESELPTGSERILFVDDEPSIAEMVKQQLKSLGYTIETRTSSVEALELLQKKHEDFDLLITDMSMPQMTGVNLVKELRRFSPDLPVILCTGFSEQINEETAREMGIAAFLLKPIIRKDMAEAIRQALGE